MEQSFVTNHPQPNNSSNNLAWTPLLTSFALIIHAQMQTRIFLLFPPCFHHYKPILESWHTSSHPFSPSLFFLFPVKKFAKGTPCLRPANTMMLYDDKGGLSFYPDLFSMKWDQPKTREGGGRGEKINSGLFGSKNIHHDSTYDNLILSHPHLDMHSRKKQPLQGWLLLANILASQLASLLTYKKKSGTWWWWLLCIVLYFF